MNDVERITEQKSNDPQYMKKYLKLALEVETDIIVWEDALNTHKAHLKNTSKEINELQNTRTQGDIFYGTKDCIRANMQDELSILENKKIEAEKKERKKKNRKKIVFGCVWVVLTAIIYPLISQALGPLVALIAALVAALLIEICIFFCFQYSLFWFSLVRSFFGHDNRDDSDKIREEIAKLQRSLHSLDKEEKQVAESNRYVDVTLPQKLKKKSYLENMINHINYHLDESKKLRAMIYDDDVLPPRYRNIVRVASLYQFLENGICTQIKGHGGIYDTYEYHLKLKDIIDNLVEIKRDVRQIRQNQEFLYDKLCDVHETLESINSGIGNAASEISSNTAMAAEAAKRTAIAQEWRNREIWYG